MESDDLCDVKNRYSMKIFSFLTIIPLCCFISFMALESKAEVRIIDKETQQPLAKASVFDKNGKFIAVTHDNGAVPSNVSNSSYPLNIRYVGYIPKDVASPDDGEINLEETSYDLPEVTVDSESHNHMVITAYVRNYITRTTEKDTVVSFEEQIIDFMFPVTKKAKVKGWKNARVLAQRTYDWGKNSKRDTVRYTEGNKGSSYSYDLDDKFILPEAMAAGNAIKEIIPGKYSDKETWLKRGDTYFLEIDGLADYKDHINKPAMAKLMGLTMYKDLEEANYKFHENGKNQFSPEDVLEASVNYHINMSGKGIKYAYDTKDPIDLYGYGEMFVIDRAYLTAEDAKELKKNPPVINMNFKAPENIPLPPPQMVKIKERVLKENPDAK